MPAEFEAQSAVWFGWPTLQWYTAEYFDTRTPIANIIQALSDHQIDAQIMCKDAAGEASAKNWLTQSGYKITQYMKFVHIDQVDIWVRDFGPIFLKNANNELAMACFEQNQWGYSTTTDPISKAMAAVPGLVADFLGITAKFPVSIVSEGGDRIVNGKGVLLVNKAVEFQRNPHATQGELETAFAQSLGVNKIIWFNNGVREDLHADWGPIPYWDKNGRDKTGQDKTGALIFLYGPQTTGGHLDEFVRFVSANKIILAQVSEHDAATNPIAAVNYARLNDAHRILSAATDQDGNPFEIVSIPVPNVEYAQIEPDQEMYAYLSTLHYPPDVPKFPLNAPIYVVKSSSYVNYLETNGLIIAPKYGDLARDNQVAQVLKEAYGRDVVQIDPSALNYAGGGIHCCTQQQPQIKS